GYEISADGSVHLTSFWDLVLNEWAVYQYMHNMGGAFVTGSFAVAALGAFYILSRKQVEYGKMFVKAGVIAGFIGSV
ncbi:cytochrome ubiquinol oxidase subunit I, partial [Acinetobacter baumannii]